MRRFAGDRTSRRSSPVTPWARSSGTAQPGRNLTTRQREVLQLLAEGRSMKEVGAILDVTPRTVAFHKYRMMEQLRLKTSAELVQFAVKQGMVA